VLGGPFRVWAYLARVVLYDRADTKRRLTVGPRQWRATLQLFFQGQVLTKEQLGRLSWRLGGAGTSIDPAECRKAGAFLEESVLGCVADDEGIRVAEREGGFDDVTDGTMTVRWRDAGEGPEPGTLLTTGWLRELAEFLLTCDGAGAMEDAFEHNPPSV
jgi:hypothetical protein